MYDAGPVVVIIRRHSAPGSQASSCTSFPFCIQYEPGPSFFASFGFSASAK
jgi:hypothetical protein